jgi:hypothetical protein
VSASSAHKCMLRVPVARVLSPGRSRAVDRHPVCKSRSVPSKSGLIALLPMSSFSQIIKTRIGGDSRYPWKCAIESEAIRIL